jgi:hypothetical protein
LELLQQIVQGNFAGIIQVETVTVNNESAGLNAEERLRIIERRLQELMNQTDD